jgi:hypothetical protein
VPSRKKKAYALKGTSLAHHLTKTRIYLLLNPHYKHCSALFHLMNYYTLLLSASPSFFLSISFSLLLFTWTAQKQLLSREKRCSLCNSERFVHVLSDDYSRSHLKKTSFKHIFPQIYMYMISSSKILKTLLVFPLTFANITTRQQKTLVEVSE